MKFYIESTQGNFKKRYYNHICNLNLESYKHGTSLSTYTWNIKQEYGIDPILKWKIKKCYK